MINLFPSAYRIEYSNFHQSLEEAHHAWWKQWQEQRQPDFVIENIRFEHDPGWRNRFFSIQSDCDANRWVWKASGDYVSGWLEYIGRTSQRVARMRAR